MTETLTIPRSQIDPEDLRGTTLAYARSEKPWHSRVGIITEPLSMIGGKKVSIVRDLHEKDGYLVSWDVILKGGSDQDLIFEGIEEELKLRLSPPPTNRKVEESITGDDLKRYWGS